MTRDFSSRHRPLVLVLSLFALSAGRLLFADPDAASSTASPFLEFRDRSLDYAGPADSDSAPGNGDPAEVGIAWFGPVDGDNSINRLAAAGVLDGDAAELRRRFIAITLPTLQGLDVGTGADGSLTTEPDLASWDPVSRRLTPPDFDPVSFEMITGAHARAMGVED